MKRIKAVVFGAGQRGMYSYASYALEHPDELEIVAVCDPDPERLELFRGRHNLPESMCFSTWQEFYTSDEPHGAEAVFICTQDDMHFEPAMEALKRGYHVLLEKPMSNQIKECFLLGEQSKLYKKVFAICHVLRYSPFFVTLKALLSEGRIGKLISIQHNENVGYWHQAHSYVRGNWRNSELSSPMILAKSCHDMDILLWLADADCVSLSSFGELTHFKREHAPEGAPLRCTDGCPVQEQCAFYAPYIYVTAPSTWQQSVIRNVVTNSPSDESVMEALRTGPYGRCVYHCDNNVVDHQVVNMVFENEVTAAFTMCGFTKECSRTIKLMGTTGEIRAHMEKNEIEIISFRSDKREIIQLDQSDEGHGGGDHGIVRSFVKQIQQQNEEESLTSAARSVQAHLMAFAAEHSRVEKKVVHLNDYIEQLKSQYSAQ